MSYTYNEKIIESLKEDFLDLGYSEHQAEDLALHTFYDREYMSDFDRSLIEVDNNED